LLVCFWWNDAQLVITYYNTSGNWKKVLALLGVKSSSSRINMCRDLFAQTPPRIQEYVVDHVLCICVD